MEDTLDRVAAMLSHKSNSSMLGYYVGRASRHRDLADALKWATTATRASFYETTSGRCTTGVSPVALTCHKAAYLTAPMARWEQSTWDFAEFIEAARRGMSANGGLLRTWSDLDRIGSLAAHLAALDRTLDS